ncbi:tetratricopeptide repeat protein [bacterium]|nr:tetratricopeptide repeat protein [bacterium]MBP9810241.1 tetratricopeptide repeat protein [bacterium]
MTEKKLSLTSALSLLLILALASDASAAPPQSDSASSGSASAGPRSGGPRFGGPPGDILPITKDEIDKPAEESRRLIARGNPRRALRVLQHNIDTNANPKKPLHMNVADWHLDPTGQNLALRELSEEQLRHLHYSEIYNLRGIAFALLRQLPEAEASLRKAITYNPQNGTALSNLATVYVQLGRLDDALAVSGQALKISDRFLDAHRHRSVVFRRKNQFDLERKEIEAYNQCRALTAKDHLNLANLCRSKYMFSLISQKAPSARKQIALGVINKQFNHFAESEKCHLAAIKLDGKLVEAHWSYGLLLMAQQKYAEAIHEFTQAISLDSTYAMPYYHRAESYALSKKYSEAIADYSKVLEMKQRNSIIDLDVYFSRAACHGRLKEFAAGIKDLNKVLTFKISSNLHAETLSNRGALYEGLGNKTQALKDYEEAMELAPNNKVIASQRGKIMLSQGEFEQATVDLSDSSRTEVGEVSKEPPSAADLKTQIAHYDKLIKMFPRTATDSLYNRGLLYLTMGDAAKAAADMQSVVAQAKECNATADSAVCYGSIALRILNKTAEAESLLQAYSKKPRSGSPAQVVPVEVNFFLHRPSFVPIKRLMNGDLKHRTRVLTLIGLDAYSRNDKNSARKYLSLVRNTGEPSMDEFAVAVSYLKRLGLN